MTDELVLEITVLVLAAFVGFEVISKVPTTLHTPLMSGTNAIHGIVIVGAIIVVGPTDSLLVEVLGTIAVAFGAINVVGGFLVTDRMLEMFKGAAAGQGRRWIGETRSTSPTWPARPLHLRPEAAGVAAHGGARQPGRGRRRWRS